MSAFLFIKRGHRSSVKICPRGLSAVLNEWRWRLHLRERRSLKLKMHDCFISFFVPHTILRKEPGNIQGKHTPSSKTPLIHSSPLLLNPVAKHTGPLAWAVGSPWGVDADSGGPPTAAGLRVSQMVTNTRRSHGGGTSPSPSRWERCVFASPQGRILFGISEVVNAARWRLSSPEPGVPEVGFTEWLNMSDFQGVWVWIFLWVGRLPHSSAIRSFTSWNAQVELDCIKRLICHFTNKIPKAPTVVSEYGTDPYMSFI